MGIPSYFARLLRQYRHILQRVEFGRSTQVANLLMDCNSIIYDEYHAMNQAGETFSEAALIDNVCQKITAYIKLLQPSDTVCIAFDGVAPMAKMYQQRRRRYLPWYLEQVGLTTVPQCAPASPQCAPAWNTAAITPGTAFMDLLMRQIRRKFNDAETFGTKQLVIYGSDDKGEGEHKLFAWVRQHKPQGLTVVYGLDADLIMLCLRHLSVAPRLMLYRDTANLLQVLDHRLQPSAHYLVDMQQLQLCINDSLGSKDEDATLDYVFMFFLLGNDFLPHVPSLNIRKDGVGTLLDVYLECKGRMPTFALINKEDASVNWPHVTLFIQQLAEQEHIRLCHEVEQRTHQRLTLHTRPDQEVYQHLPVLDVTTESYINPSAKGWQTRYYASLFDSNDTVKQQACERYLQGLTWTWHYYGNPCTNWTWHYPYAYAPLLADVAVYLRQTHTLPLFSNEHQQVTMASTPSQQLVFVLPPNMRHLIKDSKTRQQTQTVKVDDVTLHYAFCRYLWEAPMTFR